MSGTFPIHSLEAQTGVSARTLRHWIREGALPKPLGRGRGARYDERHLVVARVIQHLRTQHVSLRAIRTRVGSLSREELVALLPPAPRPTSPDGVPLPPPPPTYPFTMWELVHLMDGLFLLVNPDKGLILRRVVDDIHRYYGLPSRPSR